MEVHGRGVFHEWGELGGDFDVDGHYFGGMVAEKIEANEVAHLDFFVEDPDPEGLLGGVGGGSRHGKGVGSGY